MDYRIIKGDKIKEQRGGRSVRDIAREADGRFCIAALSKWERGVCQPTLEKLPYLLKALGCGYEDISEPVSLALNN